MGVSYYTHTIIGLKITEPDLKIETTHQHKLCKCSQNSDAFKFCPSCGTLNKFGEYKTSEYIVNYTPPYTNTYNEQSQEYDDDTHDYGMLKINGNKYTVVQLEHRIERYIAIHILHCDARYPDRPVEECPFSLETLCVMKQTLLKDLASIDFWGSSVADVQFAENFNIYVIPETC